MKIHLPSKTIFHDINAAYEKYRELSGGKAEDRHTLDWPTWDIHPFQYPVIPDGYKQSDTLVNMGDYWTWQVVAKSAEELEAELQVWRETVEVTPRQGLMILEQYGLYDAVMAVVSTLTRMQMIEFERASSFKRTHPLLNYVALQAGMSEAQIDQMFREAVDL